MSTLAFRSTIGRLGSLAAAALLLPLGGCDEPTSPRTAPESLRSSQQVHPQSVRGSMSGFFFPGSGTCPAELPLSLEITGEGESTVLGSFEIAGGHCTLPDFTAPDQLPVPFEEGRITFSTSDGDMVATYEGMQLQDPRVRNPFQVKVEMRLDPQASTGRFVGATGHIVHSGTANAETGAFSTRLRGTVTLVP